MTASEENFVLKRRRAQVSIGRLEAFDTCLRAGVHAAVDSKVRSGGRHRRRRVVDQRSKADRARRGAATPALLTYR